LAGIVHELRGTKEFQPYLNASVYFDENKEFFDAIGNRWVGLDFIFHLPSIIRNGRRASNEGFKGNYEGEGRLLGGVLVIGPGTQGVIFDYREKEFGDHPDPQEVLKAARTIIIKK